MSWWPVISDARPIHGMKLCDLIRWVRESSEVLVGNASRSDMPIIAMPPVQRSAVWRPKQVLDLWDSVMRGLPLGTFYLVRAKCHDRHVVLSDDRTATVSLPGFDLLDGQQRMRALMVGAAGSPDEKRCLWVDLGAAGAGQRPCLLITSKAQPFGYNTDSGDRLRVDDRRKARVKIEPDPDKNPIKVHDGKEPRRAFDQELFDGTIAQGGQQITQPPIPYGATPAQTFKLHELLDAWFRYSPRDVNAGIDALCTVTGDAAVRESLAILHDAFSRYANAQVALIHVDARSFSDPYPDLLTLYERIGAGGTSLSQEERLYSIYKYHAPNIRDAVQAIHHRIGRVLPATKIVATAVRIANAQIDPDRNDVPDVVAFAKAMTDPAGRFRAQLERLIPTETKDLAKCGSFFRTFARVHGLTSYADSAGEFWLPDVLLTALPAELWQVLVFWVTQHADLADITQCREEVVRLSMFWHLCVFNNEKAARWSYAHIKGIAEGRASFPGFDLYKLFVGNEESDRCAYRLTTPSEFEEKSCKPATPIWRTYTERFFDDGVLNELGSQWWWSGRKMLPWLQKAYLRKSFPGYTPLTDHEDDLPYDVDHICPYNDWGNWVYVRSRVPDPAQMRAMKDNRDAIGNGIGNLRLIDISKNRQDQDHDVALKMPFIERDGPPDTSDTDAMANWAFAPEQRKVWRRVSRPGKVAERNWDQSRLAAFQQAVEQRAAWLYRRFHDELGYESWTSLQGVGSSFE